MTYWWTWDCTICLNKWTWGPAIGQTNHSWTIHPFSLHNFTAHHPHQPYIFSLHRAALHSVKSSRFKLIIWVSLQLNATLHRVCFSFQATYLRTQTEFGLVCVGNWATSTISPEQPGVWEGCFGQHFTKCFWPSLRAESGDQDVLNTSSALLLSQAHDKCCNPFTLLDIK